MLIWTTTLREKSKIVKKIKKESMKPELNKIPNRNLHTSSINSGINRDLHEATFTPLWKLLTVGIALSNTKFTVQSNMHPHAIQFNISKKCPEIPH